jgi:ubiquinone/menaquinone biosynthesis C-methylase UbiE
MTEMREQRRGLSPEIYDKEYFLSHCGGFEEYRRSKGKELELRMHIILDLAQIIEGSRVLDIGCGRGELVLHAAKKGALSYGIDYSKEAISLSTYTLKDLGMQSSERVFLCMSNGLKLPFRSESFDRIILSDIIEHLYPNELKVLLEEVSRLIAPTGLLVIHTFPNRWFYNLYYPLRRLFLWAFPSKRGPLNPRGPYEKQMHVNEQSPISLIRLLMKDFRPYLWACHRDKMKEFLKNGPSPQSNPLYLFNQPELWSIAKKIDL